MVVGANTEYLIGWMLLVEGGREATAKGPRVDSVCARGREIGKESVYCSPAGDCGKGSLV